MGRPVSVSSNLSAKPSMSEDNPNKSPEASGNAKIDQRRALLAFLLPFVVYMVIQIAEPTPPTTPPAELAESAAEDSMLEEPTLEVPAADKQWLGLTIPGNYYPVVYTIKVAATFAVLLCFVGVYRQWPLRVSMLAVVVGLVGGVLWLVCSYLNPTGHLADWLGPEHWLYSWIAPGQRAAYNPLAAEALGPTAMGYLFLTVRFIGLALLVPIIEEAFLRAFLMRMVMHDSWASIPFGQVNRMAVAVGIAVPVLYHPEHLAALVWFSLVTWLMVRTKNYWDCVAAHAITNLMLGIVVVATGWWELW